MNNKSNPQITIITVVLNGKSYLEKTILSVINQDFKNYEFIILDGGSIDGSLEIIKKYEKNIDFWISSKDKGIYDAMNKSLKYANGDFIQFLNAGDKFNSINSLNVITKKLQKGKINLFGYSMNGKEYKPKTDFYSILTGMPCHQGIFYDRKYLTNNPFDLRFKYTSDYHNLLNALNKGIIVQHDIAIIEYDTTGVSSGKQILKQVRFERLKSVLHSNLSLSHKIIMTMYNFFRLLF